MKLDTTKKAASTTKTNKESSVVKSSVNPVAFKADPNQWGDMIPKECASMFGHISNAVGIDLTKPEQWTMESINLVQKNKEQFKQAIEWMPIVAESVAAFLEMQIVKSQFYAAICKNMFAAKKKVDKNSADMLVNFFSYQMHGQKLSDDVQRKQQLISKRYETSSKMQEDELTNAIDHLNTVEELAGAESSRRYEVKGEAAKVLSDWRTQKVERRAQAKVGHLNPQVGRQTVSVA
jgi:hypothetical protein